MPPFVAFKAKRPFRPYSACEGNVMFGTPSNVPLVGFGALIAPVSYVQWLLGAVGGLSIPHQGRGCQVARISFPATVR